MRAEAEALNARRQNYVLAMGQAQLAWQQAAVGRLTNLVRGQIPKPGEDDLRGFEWGYWQRVARGAPRKLGPVKKDNRVYSGFVQLAYSPDGRRLAATTNSGMAFVWDVASGTVESRIPPGGWQFGHCVSPRRPANCAGRFRRGCVVSCPAASPPGGSGAANC